MTTAQDPRSDATEHTRAVHREFLERLPFDDDADLADVMRGFVAPLGATAVVAREDGHVVWDATAFDFLLDDEEAPATVNPSLWRHARMCATGGLFEVTDRMYQVRNLDISNLTIVEGDTGLIVIDPLISTEAARAALDLYYAHRPHRPVVAALYSHSHIDHYGGAAGVVSPEDVAAGRVQVIAPEGFLAAAVSENLLAGTVMRRRAVYMYGALLPRDPKGMVGVGLGLANSSGRTSLIPPTVTITETGQRMVIDGLTFEFMLAPDTEAPSEMHWYIEELRALTAAENCCHTLHNTYSIRGTQIRDPHNWSRYLDETIVRWGDRADVLYGMHHWPTWGTDRIVDFLRKGRDAYRFINDETLRLANHGYVPTEIGEMVRLPEELDRHWALRDYYGTMNHNVKATYVKYLGWYDGNPATLHQLPPVEAATRYVAMMGGAEAVLAGAREAFERGDYRWVAEVVNHVVFADPSDVGARELLAATFEQLGYQTESTSWRNAYLSGAQDLRQGSPRFPGLGGGSTDTLYALPLELFVDYLSVRVDGERAGSRRLRFALSFTDTGEAACVELSNGSLFHRAGEPTGPVDLTARLTRGVLPRLALGATTIDEEVAAGELVAEPDIGALAELLDLLDTFDMWFPLIEP